VLRDSQGHGRAALAFTPDNSPLLVLNQSDGTLGLEVPEDRPIFSLYDRRGKPRAVFGLDSDRSPGVALVDQDGKTRAGLAISSQGSDGLALNGNEGQPRAVLALSKNWSPFMLLADDSGKPHAIFGASDVQAAFSSTTVKKADYSVALLDNSGKVLWSALEQLICSKFLLKILGALNSTTALFLP
jgi:hypothetical protein